MPLKDDLYALSKLKRSKPNFTKIEEQLTELRQLSDGAEEALEKLAAAREALSELGGALDDADETLLPWASDLQLAITEFESALPSEDADGLGERISEAEDLAEAFEEASTDREYSAQDREDAWGELLDALIAIAEAL